jgi:hypothetical protein
MQIVYFKLIHKSLCDIWIVAFSVMMCNLVSDYTNIVEGPIAPIFRVKENQVGMWVSYKERETNGKWGKKEWP